MNWYIEIGNYKLKMIEKVTIMRSVEQLSDTATIVLPATVYNKALEIEDKVKRGDEVFIAIGYNGYIVPEFYGYLESISTDGGSLTFNCEDSIFLYRISVPDKEFTNPSVKTILEYINKEVSKVSSTNISLVCDYDFSYDKFVIKDATAYDVLKKIQEEAKPNVYLKYDELHVHPQYTEIFGQTNYNFAKNIDAEGIDLKYKKADDRKVRIVIEYSGKDGKTYKYEYGNIVGDKITKQAGTTDQKSIKLLAFQEYESRVYTGYEGSFKSWLIPYCDAGYKVKIIDPDYEYKNGYYYVLSVQTEFSQSGGVRTISIGKKLRDE